ncbi:MAG: LOG family protein [Candidatus Eremiobacterota bacterium]
MLVNALRGIAQAVGVPLIPGRASGMPCDLVDLSTRAVISRPELARFHANVRKDLPLAERFLEEHHSGVFVLGSARTPPGSPDFEFGEEVGEALAEVGADLFSGGGPGLMWAGPLGFLRARDRFVGPPQQGVPRTLAVSLDNLPREQRVNDAIEESATLSEFLFRKVALYRNGRAFVSLPGGFGTLDEVFEIWAQTARDQHKGHLGMFQTSFWRPILNSIYDVAVRERKLIDPSSWEQMRYTDDVRRFLSNMPSKEEVRAGQEPFASVAARMQAEITDTVQILDDLPEAVVMTGGRGLAPDDPTLSTLRTLSRMLARDGQTLRVGNPPEIAAAVVGGALEGDPEACVQALKLKSEDLPDGNGLQVVAEQTDFILHRELLTRSARGLVYAPGGLGTLSSLFAALTQMQTRKRERVPIVLVGKSFWEPIFQAIQAAMLNSERQYIGEDDMSLVTITDDPQVAYNAVRGFPLHLRWPEVTCPDTAKAPV